MSPWEDQSMLSSQCPSCSILSTRRRLQCTVTLFLTVGHASLLRFLLCMKPNVDQFVSQDPAEVTWDRTPTAMCCSSGVWAPNDIHQRWLAISLALCAQLFAFLTYELYELYVIYNKVHKVQGLQANKKAQKVRTSQLWPKYIDLEPALRLGRSNASLSYNPYCISNICRIDKLITICCIAVEQAVARWRVEVQRTRSRRHTFTFTKSRRWKIQTVHVTLSDAFVKLQPFSNSDLQISGARFLQNILRFIIRLS